LGKTGLAAGGSSQAAERGRAAAVDSAKESTVMADRKPGDPPADATEDRGAQDHELADIETGGKARPGLYPADDIETREGDITPDAARPAVDWDTRVQPERADESDDIEKEGT
jgi:hypothetical protein